jgi:hypothetical protein
LTSLLTFDTPCPIDPSLTYTPTYTAPTTCDAHLISPSQLKRVPWSAYPIRLRVPVSTSVLLSDASSPSNLPLSSAPLTSAVQPSGSPPSHLAASTTPEALQSAVTTASAAVGLVVCV